MTINIMRYFNRAAIQDKNDPTNSFLITRILVLICYIQNMKI